MKHVLRKYLSRRGSALFMVLSLMTALMVLVMAMYFSVVASKDTQYKVFYQEQSYRSAISLSDAILNGLSDDSWKPATGSNSLRAAMATMKVGETITTTGNSSDFKAFSASGTKEEQDQLGAYTVSITRMNDETINNVLTNVYDIAITVSTGGVIDTVHTIIHMAVPTTELRQGKSQIFASTGYVPNDVYLYGVKTYTDLFYDNEFVYITGQSRFFSNISAGGSMLIDQTGGDPGLDRPLTWAIRNNLTVKSTLQLSNSSTNRGLLLVGGDFTMSSDVNNADIYVLGDFYYNGGNLDDNRVFVYGKVYGSPNPAYGLYTKDDWKDDAKRPSGAMTTTQMANKLNALTSSTDYAKWEINDYAPAKDYYVPYLDPNGKDASGNGLYNPITIKFDKDHYTNYLDWSDGYQIKDYFGKDMPLKYTPYVIDDIVADWTGADGSRLSATLVIDTGDDPQNQVLIRVNANRDYDGDGVKETFEWAPPDNITVKIDPETNKEVTTKAKNYATMTVLVRGKGSVIMDIPEGVTYQASDTTWVMHETWYAILGGKTQQMGAADNRNTLAFTHNGGSVMLTVQPDVAMKYIHAYCPEDCSGCDYKTDENTTCLTCKGNMKTISCEKHQMQYSFCPKCDPGLEPMKDTDGDYYGLCTSRIHRKAIKDAVDNLSTEWKDRLKASGDGTNWYYPNNNIFLVSCDESADIRLATDRDGNAFDKSSLWGFVYAPYMTYKGMGDGAGWVVFCGGMVVADYVIKNYDIYLACYPDVMPENNMNQKDRETMLDAVSPKDWKISLAGY